MLIKVVNAKRSGRNWDEEAHANAPRKQNNTYVQPNEKVPKSEER